jgi:hypothetical protein
MHLYENKKNVSHNWCPNSRRARSEFSELSSTSSTCREYLQLRRSDVQMKISRKKMFAIVGAIIAGGFGIAVASAVPQAAHAGVMMN